MTSSVGTTLFTPGAIANPYPEFARLRPQSPVYIDDGAATRYAQHGLWCLLRYDDVYGALQDHETFSSDQGNRDGGAGQMPLVLLNDDPPRHTRFRRLVNKAFTPKRIAELEPWNRIDRRRAARRYGERPHRGSRQLHHAPAREGDREASRHPRRGLPDLQALDRRDARLERDDAAGAAHAVHPGDDGVLRQDRRRAARPRRRGPGHGARRGRVRRRGPRRLGGPRLLPPAPHRGERDDDEPDGQTSSATSRSIPSSGSSCARIGAWSRP